jgi:aminotransferase in exopolysaccharide biosynthesis
VSDVGSIIEAIRSVAGNGAALHEPHFGGRERDYVGECLDTTMVSSVGGFVDRFERDLADYTSARHVVAVVNGTAALQVALQLAGIERGDEVLAPALTFAATANAIVHAGAIPHFVDVEQRTLGLDAGKLRDYLRTSTTLRDGVCVNRTSGHAIRAVVPMHTFGHPVDMEPLLAVALDYHLAVVEDAAESLGSVYRGKHTGTFGTLAALSFNGNKTITTGGGGAILTNDPVLARRAKHLTTTAKIEHPWEYRHDAVGFNYRMPNLNAALGCAQLEQLESFLAAKRQLHQRYKTAFANVADVRVIDEPDGCRSNYWLQAIMLECSDPMAVRNAVLAAANAAGLGARPVWALMHHLPHFAGCPRMDLEVSESLESRLVNVPSSPQLMFKDR